MYRSTPPSIVLEDVDRKLTNLLDFRSSSLKQQQLFLSPTLPTLPSCYVTDLRRKSLSPVEEPAIVHPGQPQPATMQRKSSFSLQSINMCTVDAYVSPLSLCSERAMVVSGGKLPLSSSENSFTSVDIGRGGSSSINKLQPATADASWNSWKSDESSSDGSSINAPTGCCFDIHSGLMSVTRAITTGFSDNNRPQSQHHRVDITDVGDDQLPPDGPKKRKGKWSTCSIIGIFFIILAVVGIISVGIAMYVEFVTKPSILAASKLPVLNETTLCDYLLDSCNNSATAMATPNGTVDLAAAVRNESGRIEGKFSPSFINQISVQLPK